ncbi:serine hydrolase, partial [bacterium]|nr:serine hydrolase [bacterium]
VELMLQNHLSGVGMSDSFWPGVGFGFGFAVLYDAGKYGEIGSPGTIWWAGSTNVHYWIDPREELVGVLMVQVRPFPYLNIMDLVRSMSLHALN